MPIVAANGQVAASPVVSYDPITRVVRIEAPSEAPNGEWLDDNQFYTVVLGIPPGTDTSSGLRAIDGATLDPALPATARQISFYACARTGSKCQDPGAPIQPAPAPTISYCDDVQPIFLAHCASAVCHAAPGAGHRPAMGLVLDVGEGVRLTAINRAAEESTTGATSRPEAPGRLFGVNMPIVDPGRPGTSYLLYKLLMAVPPSGDAGLAPGRPICFGDGGTAPVTATPPSLTSVQPQPLSDSERAILSNLVPGREMPYPSDPAAPLGSPSDNPPLTNDELERLRLWIDQGAPVETCVPCALADGGASPPPDASADGSADAAAD